MKSVNDFAVLFFPCGLDDRPFYLTAEVIEYDDTCLSVFLGCVGHFYALWMFKHMFSLVNLERSM